MSPAGQAADFEQLLRRALRPVDPPAALSQRVEATLVELTELAAEELESWELGAMRDPRNWLRPAAAVVVGAGAGAGLVVLRARGRQRSRRDHGRGALDRAGRTVRDLAGEARRRLEHRGR